MYETTHNTMEIKNASMTHNTMEIKKASMTINFNEQINYKLRVAIPIFCYISNHMHPGK